MTGLTGKVALITGSGRGLGRAVAERLASLGAAVVVNYAGSAQAAADVVSRIEADGGRAVAVQADVSDVAAIDRLFDAAAAAFGRLDIVVANAGIELVGRAATILPSATDGAGVSATGPRPELRAMIDANPMRRMGTLKDTADAAEYLCSDLSGYVSGQHLLLSGGAPA